MALAGALAGDPPAAAVLVGDVEDLGHDVVQAFVVQVAGADALDVDVVADGEWGALHAMSSSTYWPWASRSGPYWLHSSPRV